MTRFVLSGVLVLCAVLSVAAGQCNACDGTRATACKDYAGEPTATQPYDATPIVTVTLGEMDTILARVALHNPTEVEATASVTCAFFLDDWEAGTNTINDVAVCANSTVFAELQYGGDFGERARVGVDCVTTW